MHTLSSGLVQPCNQKVVTTAEAQRVTPLSFKLPPRIVPRSRPASRRNATTELQELANGSASSRCRAKLSPATNPRQFVKLVSDGGTATGATAMEDETIFGEKQSIRDSARTLKKYGSISGSSSGNSCGVAASGSRSPALLATEALIRHDVERTDTLQGIALKYGCSVSRPLFSVFFTFILSLSYMYPKVYNIGMFYEDLLTWLELISLPFDKHYLAVFS